MPDAANLNQSGNQTATQTASPNNSTNSIEVAASPHNQIVSKSTTTISNTDGHKTGNATALLQISDVAGAAPVNTAALNGGAGANQYYNRSQISLANNTLDTLTGTAQGVHPGDSFAVTNAKVSIKEIKQVCTDIANEACKDGEWKVREYGKTTTGFKPKRNNLKSQNQPRTEKECRGTRQSPILSWPQIK